jgi:hypothetical protein
MNGSSGFRVGKTAYQGESAKLGTVRNGFKAIVINKLRFEVRF